MKLRLHQERNEGLTGFDVLVAVLLTFLVLALLFAFILPMNRPNRRRAEQINCINNLKQINVAYRVWEADNRNAYGIRNGEKDVRDDIRMAVLKTNADTEGLNSGQTAWMNVMRASSNMLSTLKVLQCPADHETPITTNAAGLKIRFSYFLDLDASEMYPQTILAGDDNIAIQGARMKPGILGLSPNTAASWESGRHGLVNNITFSDGSAGSFSSSGLQTAIRYSLRGTALETNRLAIP